MRCNDYAREISISTLITHGNEGGEREERGDLRDEETVEYLEDSLSKVGKRYVRFKSSVRCHLDKRNGSIISRGRLDRLPFQSHFMENGNFITLKKPILGKTLIFRVSLAWHGCLVKCKI